MDIHDIDKLVESKNISKIINIIEEGGITSIPYICLKLSHFGYLDIYKIIENKYLKYPFENNYIYMLCGSSYYNKYEFFKYIIQKSDIENIEKSQRSFLGTVIENIVRSQNMKILIFLFNNYDINKMIDIEYLIGSWKYSSHFNVKSHNKFVKFLRFLSSVDIKNKEIRYCSRTICLL